MRYSGLAQINRSNVKKLQVAWSFDSGETGGLQTSPLMVDGVLYALRSNPPRATYAIPTATVLPTAPAGSPSPTPSQGGISD